MTDLKLGKLPDRTPVKITFTAGAELNKSLQTYAEFYRETYGQEEPVPELIPYMLEAFLKSDSTFAKVRREKLAGNSRPAAAKPQRPRPHSADASTHTS